MPIAVIEFGRFGTPFGSNLKFFAGLTAGGLVFGGSNEGNVFALDASTGKALWDFQTGGAVRTNPMGFAVDGKQRVVSTGGSTLYVFGLE